MEAPVSQDTDSLDLCRFFWEEYKYRHDLVWQRIFRFTSAVVVISIIPYTRKDVVDVLEYWVLIAPLLASLLAGFVLVVMWNELEHLRRIKEQYRRHQNVLLDDDLQHRPPARSAFSLFVMVYLTSLVLLSIFNAVLLWRVWIPSI